MKKLRTVLIVLIALALFLFSTSGHFLIINRPQHADTIVVLAGETDRRPALGLQLLQQGYAPRMVLDVPANAKIYDETMLQISQQYIRELPQAQSVIICPIYGLSTKAESQDVSPCLRTLGVHSVLVVTSDYHTRRALSTSRHEWPGVQISVAAASAPPRFGREWWRPRQWAKFNFTARLRLECWQAADRCR